MILVLNENVVGCGITRKDDLAAIFFNVANFKRPWQDEEEVILIIEATKQGRGYFTVVNVTLDACVDVQDLDNITLMPIPAPVIAKGSMKWDGVDNDNVVGYSLYQGDKRMNEKVIARNRYSATNDVSLRPVIKGGYETVYGSGVGPQSTTDKDIPISFAFNILPNPFIKQTRIDYALPKQTAVEIVIYDVAGRQVKTLLSALQKPGYYSAVWNGADDKGRKVASGIYFVRFETSEFRAQDKILLVK